MKHLFFVSVALGFFSGTSISAKAQASVNAVRVNEGNPAKFSTKFIEGIEMKNSGVANYPGRKHVSDAGTNIETCSAFQFKFAQLMNIEVEAGHRSTETNLHKSTDDHRCLIQNLHRKH